MHSISKIKLSNNQWSNLNSKRQTMVSNPNFSLPTLVSNNQANRLTAFSRRISSHHLSARITLLYPNKHRHLSLTRLLSSTAWIVNSSNFNLHLSTITRIVSKILPGDHSERNNKFKHMASLSKFQCWALMTKNLETAPSHRFPSDSPSMGLNQSALTRKSHTRTLICCLYRLE